MGYGPTQRPVPSGMRQALIPLWIDYGLLYRPGSSPVTDAFFTELAELLDRL